MQNDVYSKFVVNKLLNLREGDALSVNTEEISFPLAREIANEALKVTNYPVKIVVTDNGKPVEVTDFEPQGLASQVKAMAMVRINYIKPEQTNQNNALNVVVDKDDLATCQKLGHLAEPVDLERRIAVPFCVVPFYNSNDSRWQEVEKAVEEFDSSSILVRYRKQNLSHMDIHTLRFIGENTDFSLTLPEDVDFISDYHKLNNGREFNSSIFTSNIITVVDKNVSEGFFTANATIFGKQFKLEAKFINGMAEFKEIPYELKQLLSFDPEVSRCGFISLSDKHFVLNFGGAVAEPVLDIIKDNELPDFFNSSVYSLKLELDPKLSVIAIDCDGQEKELIRKGFFLD